MEEWHNQLATMGSPVSEASFLALVMKSVPASYCPMVQAIDTNTILTSRITTLSVTPGTVAGTTLTTIAASGTDVIGLLIHEARH
jgi:hypothetical protein